MPSNPNLKLKPRDSNPYARITIKRLPMGLLDQLRDRAQKMNKRLPIYCRIILEHAANHPSDYDKLITKGFAGEELISHEINIPVVNKQFLENLKDWDPFGDETANRIATTLLIKHFDEHDW